LSTYKNTPAFHERAAHTAKGRCRSARDIRILPHFLSKHNYGQRKGIKMKKTTALILVVTLLLAMGTVAFATGSAYFDISSLRAGGGLFSTATIQKTSSDDCGYVRADSLTDGKSFEFRLYKDDKTTKVQDNYMTVYSTQTGVTFNNPINVTGSYGTKMKFTTGSSTPIALDGIWGVKDYY